MCLAASALLLAACLQGCGSEPGDASGASDAANSDAGASDAGPLDAGPQRDLGFCEGTTRQLYDPLSGTSLDLFPDDQWSRPDPGTATGIRLQVDSATPWLAALPESFQPVLRDLSTLDGWGTTASLFVRFDAEVAAPPSGEAASTSAAGVQLWQLEPKAARIPFEASRTDDGATLVIAPMVPLRPKTRHLLVVTRDHSDAKGGCIAPSEGTAAILERRAADPGQLARAPGWEAALAAAGVAPADVSAMSVFTTQSITEESLAVAKHIAAQSYTWSVKPTCEDVAGKPYRKCEGRFKGQEYRKDRTVSAEPQGALEHVVRLWLPKAGGPWPIVVFGHGLTGDKDQGEPLAKVGAPLGIAAVAIDAAQHGEHPAGGHKSLAAVLHFFGIDPAKLAFDFLALRDNWRQSTFDKLQLLQLLAQQPDLDGDGKPELDPTRVAYVGVSLGGIMGPEMLALSSQVQAAVLSVPGGKVSSIIESSEQFGPIIVAFQPEGTTKGDVARFFPVLQTLIERGDAANWGGHVLRERVVAGEAPHVLLQMAINDEIVPNVANRALARAMRTPHLGEPLQTVGIVPHTPTLPQSGNITLADGAKRTAGIFQFDRITKSEGAPVKVATHSSTPASREALAQDKAFLEGWLAGGLPEIIDPYALLKTPKK